MTKIKSVDIVSKMVEMLSPLPSEERVRVIQAVMVLLGESPATMQNGKSAEDGGIDDSITFPPRAKAWMKQNGITVEELEQVYQLAEGGPEVIAAHIPGKNKKEQMYNAYILTGIAQLLVTGTPSFQDNLARKLCESSGCYDSANHAAHLKNRGNEFSGTKDKGWVLTNPGLVRGGELIKELNKRA